jgi:hypothetical protein
MADGRANWTSRSHEVEEIHAITLIVRDEPP